MITTFLIYFNIILFLGFGAELVLFSSKSSGRNYFLTAAVNSFTLVAVTSISAAVIALAPQYFKNDIYLFIFSVSTAFFINQSFYWLLSHADNGIFDSLNFISCLVPFYILKFSPTAAEAVPHAIGAAAGFSGAAAVFFFVRKRISLEAAGLKEFNVFCCELITLGFLSISLSLFFKAV